MRRPVLIGTALATAALAVTACGGGGSSAGGDPQSLIDTAYSVTTLTVGGADREVLGPVEIAFTADTVSVMTDRKSTRLNSSHIQKSRMPSSA